MPPRSPDRSRVPHEGPTSAPGAAADWLRGLGSWGATVLASSAIVVVVVLALGVGWLASRRTATTNTVFSRPLSQVDLALASGQAVIVGSSSPTLEVRRTDHYSFGHSATERRYVAGGVLHIVSHCPKILLGSCSASYELMVPEKVAVHVQTTSGDVRISGLTGNAAVHTRTGSVDVEAYCGFELAASSGSGNVHVATACTPESLNLRTGSGNAVALVPPGRYQIAAHSRTGSQRISGVLQDPTAPFTIDVRSSSGSVAVEGGV